VIGVKGHLIEVEADIGEGLPSMSIVGLPDTAVAESRQRVRAAIRNSGHAWPDRRVTVSLSPASVHKRGSGLDIAIATAVLIAAGQVPSALASRTVLLGELALDGRVRAVNGVLAVALAASASNAAMLVVPRDNAREAALVQDIAVAPVTNLNDVLALFRGESAKPLPPAKSQAATKSHAFAKPQATTQPPTTDLADVKGQEVARLALEVCAAGGHHLAMTGPPGVGKTLLASLLPTLLPDLSARNSLRVTATHSAAGALAPGAGPVTRPPLVAPHHSTSATALIGGGSANVRVGLVSLADQGVLFLDETPEFRRECLDALRQPLEHGHVTVSRVGYHVVMPAKFQLCCAANRCPCGPAVGKRCECTGAARRRYLMRFSGPLLDRIDLRLGLNLPTKADLKSPTAAEATEVVAARVLTARKRAEARLRETPWQTNGEVAGAYLRKSLWPSAAGELLDRAYQARRISLRGVERVVRVAWSIADCVGHHEPTSDDIGLALSMRDSTDPW
jgi:magnesium chelatase family protein